MLRPVPDRVLGGVAQAEVRRQVDHHTHPPAQLGDDALGFAVGQGAKDEVEAVEQHRVVVAVDETGVGRRQ